MIPEKNHKIEFDIDKEMEGTRIDLVLSGAFDDMSRSYIQKLFEKGKIEINGTVCTEKKYKAKAGDRIVIDVPEAEFILVEAVDLPLDIVYEDYVLLVVY